MKNRSREELIAILQNFPRKKVQPFRRPPPPTRRGRKFLIIPASFAAIRVGRIARQRERAPACWQRGGRIAINFSILSRFADHKININNSRTMRKKRTSKMSSLLSNYESKRNILFFIIIRSNSGYSAGDKRNKFHLLSTFLETLNY